MLLELDFIKIKVSISLVPNGSAELHLCEPLSIDVDNLKQCSGEHPQASNSLI